MINAKELRIGNNILEYRFDFEKGQMADVIIDVTATTITQACLNTNNLFPIELTEDIIIKCGFQKLSFNDGRHLFKLNEFYIEQRGFKFNRVEVNDAGNRIMYVGGKTTCDYVHQLQNLYYALIGEELNVEPNVKVSDTTKA